MGRSSLSRGPGRCAVARRARSAHTLPSKSKGSLMSCLPRVVASAVAFTACSLVHAAGFTLTSPTVKPGAKLPETHVFNSFGCSGKNVSPALKWSGAPKDTKSFAVTVYDPDAPTGSGWWHWVVINIPATATELPEGAGGTDAKGLPAGAVQGKTDFG